MSAARPAPDLDLTWAAVNSLVLALGTFILRGHIERNLPEPLTSPAQLERWHASVNHCFCVKDCSAALTERQTLSPATLLR